MNRDCPDLVECAVGPYETLRWLSLTDAERAAEIEADLDRSSLMEFREDSKISP
jgi:hypothetical protein